MTYDKSFARYTGHDYNCERRRPWKSQDESCLLFSDNFYMIMKAIITKTRLLKYIENFTIKKGKNFHMKNSGSFHISAHNIDAGYLLEPLRQGGSNE